MHLLQGKLASPGFALAHATWLHSPPKLISLKPEQARTTTEQIPHELARFQSAKASIQQHLEQIQARLSHYLPETSQTVFAPHRTLLQDVGFVARVEKELERGPYKAEKALERALRIYEGFIKATAHETFRIKMLELNDVWGQVYHYLQTGTPLPPLPIHTECIVLADDILASQFAQLPFHLVKGLLLKGGGHPSTLSSLTHALHIPYFCRVDNLESATEGELIFIDGTAETILVSPEQDRVSPYRSLAQQWNARYDHAAVMRHERQTLTRCGQAIQLTCAISNMADIDLARLENAAGIGALHTTDLLASLDALAPEPVQQELYQSICQSMSPSPVRMIAFAPKEASDFPQLRLPQENNPLLGWRGIRVPLVHRPLLLQQLCALLETSRQYPIQLAIPTITTLEEMSDISLLLNEARQLVDQRPHTSPTQLSLGLQIDTPAIVLSLVHVLPFIEFVQIDTTTLLQLTMGAAVENPRLRHLTSPVQPAFLRLLGLISDAIQAAELPMNACGNMVTDPLGLPLLLGMGCTEVVTPVNRIADIKQRIQTLRIPQTQQLFREAQRCTTVQQVSSLVRDALESMQPNHTNDPLDAPTPLTTPTAKEPQHAPTPRSADITAQEPS
jgi:phosphotransferase system enzyme I (PtsI)